MIEGLRCRVSGRVQGVFYRRSAQEAARRLGVTGSARNLPDGRVEVQAFGEAQALQEFLAWLRQGPTLARVISVETEPLVLADGQTAPTHFETG